MTSYLIVFEKELFEMVDMLEIKLLVLVWVLISNKIIGFLSKKYMHKGGVDTRQY